MASEGRYSSVSIHAEARRRIPGIHRISIIEAINAWYILNGLPRPSSNTRRSLVHTQKCFDGVLALIEKVHRLKHLEDGPPPPTYRTIRQIQEETGWVWQRVEYIIAGLDLPAVRYRTSPDSNKPITYFDVSRIPRYQDAVAAYAQKRADKTRI